MESQLISKEVEVKIDNVTLSGEVVIPETAQGVVLFSHGSGSSRFSPRNKYVAQCLQKADLGTFLFDLLTPEEDSVYENRFNIELITQRLTSVTTWFLNNISNTFSIGYFGASTGAASALWSAATLGETVKAVVSRGGRPDLAIPVLPDVKAATLLIVGSLDYYVIDLNEKAYSMLMKDREMIIIEGATHLFEEPGTLDEVANHATNWFNKHLK